MKLVQYFKYFHKNLYLCKALCCRGRAQTIIFKKNCHFYSKKGLVGSVNIGLVRLESHDLSPTKKRFTRSIGFLRSNFIVTKAKWTKEIHVGKVYHQNKIISLTRSWHVKILHFELGAYSLHLNLPFLKRLLVEE